MACRILGLIPTQYVHVLSAPSGPCTREISSSFAMLCILALYLGGFPALLIGLKSIVPDPSDISHEHVPFVKHKVVLVEM